MKKVAPNGRSLESDMPFTMAAIECSRMPKWKFLPPGVPGSKFPAPSYLRVVLFDEPRSAEPPSSHGMFWASTFSTWPEASRPAMPFGSGLNTGRFLSQPAGSSRRCICSTSVASSGNLRLEGGEGADPFPPRRGAPRADARREALVDAIGDEELCVLRPAEGALGQLRSFL